MTTGAQSVRRAAPASLKDWAIVAKHAAVTIGRAVALIVAIYTLARVTGSASIYLQVGEIVVSMTCLYLALGAGARAWAFYVVAFVLFAQLRALADEIGTPVQFAYAIQMEKALFLGWFPMTWLQDMFYSHARLGILEGYTMFVYLSYFFVPHAVALAIWRWDRQRFRQYVPAFLITIYIGLVVCALLPTAPPWMASEAGKIPTVYQIVPDILNNEAPGLYQAGENTAGTNAVAAMPSLHAAIPWLMVMACWNHRRVRWLAMWYAVSMSFSVVYLGEHYFVDAMAGLAAASVSWVAAGRILAWWEGRAVIAGNARRAGHSGEQQGDLVSAVSD
jgi:membrane-associated phospholipid phosphatase